MIIQGWDCERKQFNEIKPKGQKSQNGIMKSLQIIEKIKHLCYNKIIPIEQVFL